VSVELATFTLAVIVIGAMRIPRPAGAVEPVSLDALLSDLSFGIRWIFAHRPLFKFLLVATFANFFISLGEVVMQPYGLSFLDKQPYGIVNGLFGGGMIAGGVVVGMLSRRFTNIQQFLGSALLVGALYVAYGFSRDPYSLGTMNFAIAAMMTIGNASIMTIWQVKVPEELQGRVFSAMQMVADVTTPISFLLVVPLTEKLVPWLFARSGAASVWGASATGEMGALFSTMGAVVFVGFLLASAVRDVREVEQLPV
jgi:hypothetical protein